MPRPKPKIFVINRSSHDLSAAEKFGDLVYLSEGSVSPFNTNLMCRKFSEKLENSKPTDYILLTSLTVMCSLACSIFSRKHGRLNLLLFKDGGYIERKHVFD